MKNLIDKIFILIVLICLFIPVFNFKEQDVQRYENRKINIFPTNYRSRHYAKHFERYISDRFCFKYGLIHLNRNLKFLLSKYYYSTDNNIIDKKNNLIYTNTFWGMYNSDANLYEIIESISWFNNYCKSKNIKLYLLIVPRRSNFIKYNTYYKKLENNKNVFDYGEHVVHRLQNETDVAIIYPVNEMLKENKNNPVYYKTDHHWTDSGIYVSYKALMNEIKKPYPDIKILDKNDMNISYSNKVSSYLGQTYNNGSLLNKSGISNSIANSILDTQYLYYTHPDADTIKNHKESTIKNFDIRYDDYYIYPKGYDKKVMLIGDSFSGGLLKILPFTFKETLKFGDHPREMYFEKYKDAIDDFKPDIIILNSRTFYMFIYKNLYKSKENK